MADNYNNQPERKSPKWLLWIPLVLLLLLGLYALYAATRDDQAVVNDQTQSEQVDQPDQAPATAGDETTLRSLAALQAETDSTALVGRTVILDNEPVAAVIGDRSFTIGETTTPTYAVLDENLNDANSEQAVRVQAGQSYDIEGVIVAAPESAETIMQEFQLTETQAQELQQQGYYIAVNRINA